VETYDVAIVGGGLIGCSIAYELALEKLKVLVLEKQEPGREASWAAAGMLSPSPESGHDIPLVPLSRESLRIYPEFVNTIEGESGKTAGYACNGTLETFFGTDAEEKLAEFVGLHNGLQLKTQAVSIKEARTLGLSRDSGAQAAAFLPDEATVEPRLLMEAVLAAVRNRGVEIRTQYEVTAFRYQGNRCVGVIGKDEVTAKCVVVAAGCFSGALTGNNLPHFPVTPTRPVRGQLLALRRHGFALKRVLRSKRGYLVPRDDGRVVAGSTIEEVGFEKKVTAGGIRKIIEMAVEQCPELNEAELLEAWCGLRPGTPDALPILGPVTEGLIMATGHYRNGILLAPITARLVREWIVNGETSFDPLTYSPLRFGKAQSECAHARC
jgi:glycine oxidase